MHSWWLLLSESVLIKDSELQRGGRKSGLGRGLGVLVSTTN